MHKLWKPRSDFNIYTMTNLLLPVPATLFFVKDFHSGIRGISDNVNTSSEVSCVSNTQSYLGIVEYLGCYDVIGLERLIMFRISLIQSHPCKTCHISDVLMFLSVIIRNKQIYGSVLRVNRTDLTRSPSGDI
jgi:hypothetical protein